MGEKIVDATLVSIKNTGTLNISPNGFISVQRARSVDDEQIFQSEVLYEKQSGGLMHPSGATFLEPGQTLVYNRTKRLTVHRFEVEDAAHLNEMLMFRMELTQRVVDNGTLFPAELYQGGGRTKLQFDEITGVNTVIAQSNVVFNGQTEHKILVEFSVRLV